jgi:hypothetical protein
MINIQVPKMRINLQQLASPCLMPNVQTLLTYIWNEDGMFVWFIDGLVFMAGTLQTTNEKLR